MSSLKGLKSPNPVTLSTGHGTASHFYSRKQKDEESLGLFMVPTQWALYPQLEREKRNVVISCRTERRKKADRKRKGLCRKSYLARFPRGGKQGAVMEDKWGMDIPYECLPQMHCLSAA